MGGPPAQIDYFISYTSADRAWAEWIAWQLKQAGSSVVLQAWDMIPGRDFVHEMQKATTTARRTIAVLSPAYLTSQFGEAEWGIAFASDPRGEKGRLVPVRVADFVPEGLLATRIYIDLVTKDRQAARTALLEGLEGQEIAIPTEEPRFPGKEPTALETFAPGQQEPRFPSALARGPTVPHPSSPALTGRGPWRAELVHKKGFRRSFIVHLTHSSHEIEFAYRYLRASVAVDKIIANSISTASRPEPCSFVITDGDEKIAAIITYTVNTLTTTLTSFLLQVGGQILYSERSRFHRK